MHALIQHLEGIHKMREFILAMLIPAVAEAVGSGIANKVHGRDVSKSLQSGFASGLAAAFTGWLMLLFFETILGIV